MSSALETTPILSILICSLASRSKELAELTGAIDAQRFGLADTNMVEVVVNTDNGELTVGAKRNELIARAHGEYVAFVDDDDMVSDDYVSQVISAIMTSHPDVVGLVGEITLPAGTVRRFEHSIEYATWYESDDVFYRTPNHLNPVKRTIAKKVPFREIKYGEDANYSARIRPLLHTEEMITEPIYFYNNHVINADALEQEGLQ